MFSVCINFSMKLQQNKEKNQKIYLKELNVKIQIFYHTKESGKILNKTVSQLLLMSYFHHKIMKKNNFEQENNVVLLMVIDDSEKNYYFAVKTNQNYTHLDG